MSTLKSMTRKLAESIVASDTIWNPLSKTLVRGSQFLCAMRNNHEADRTVIGHLPSRKNALAEKTYSRGRSKE